MSNIDADHLDHYKYFQGLKDAFLSYINTIPFYGYSVLCIDDTTVRELLPKVERPYYTYGLSEDADFRAVDIAMDGRHDPVPLPLPGRVDRRVRHHGSSGTTTWSTPSR